MPNVSEKEEMIVLGCRRRLMIVPRTKRITGDREKRRTSRDLSMKAH